MRKCLTAVARYEMDLAMEIVTELQKLYDAIVSGDTKSAVAMTSQALEDGVQPMALITKFMVSAMDEVGRRFEREEYFVPELLLSGRAMHGALDLLRPRLAATGSEPAGRVIVGTVKGDLHDIGKNLVSSMLEGAGFEVLDLGTDVAPDAFAEVVKAKDADVVALSALLTVTMPNMKATIEALKRHGVRDRVKVIIGGAPVTQDFADAIGADGYGATAVAAVALARTMTASPA